MKIAILVFASSILAAASCAAMQQPGARPKPKGQNKTEQIKKSPTAHLQSKKQSINQAGLKKTGHRHGGCYTKR